MSDQSQISNNEKKDTIRYRIDFIKKLLAGKVINPLVDFDNTATENFIGKTGDDESGGSFDTRIALKKKCFKDFNDVIYRIGNNKGEQLRYIKSGTSGHTFHGRVKNDNGEFFE